MSLTQSERHRIFRDRRIARGLCPDCGQPLHVDKGVTRSACFDCLKDKAKRQLEYKARKLSAKASMA